MIIPLGAGSLLHNSLFHFVSERHRAEFILTELEKTALTGNAHIRQEPPKTWHSHQLSMLEKKRKEKKKQRKRRSRGRRQKRRTERKKDKDDSKILNILTKEAKVKNFNLENM